MLKSITKVLLPEFQFHLSRFWNLTISPGGYAACESYLLCCCLNLATGLISFWYLQRVSCAGHCQELFVNGPVWSYQPFMACGPSAAIGSMWKGPSFTPRLAFPSPGTEAGQSKTQRMQRLTSACRLVVSLDHLMSLRLFRAQQGINSTEWGERVSSGWGGAINSPQV